MDVIDKCNTALEASTKEIEDLKAGVKQLEDKVADASERPIIPFWLIAIVALGTGGAGAILAVPALIGVGAGLGTAALGLSIKE